MANLIVNQGLLSMGQNISRSTNYAAVRYIRCMAVDDATGSFIATNTKLNDGAGYTSSYSKDFDSTPTELGQTITHIMTIPTVSFNTVPVRRISLHNDSAANVGTSGVSVTLVGGIDGQSLQKTVDFSIAITLKLLYTSV